MGRAIAVISGAAIAPLMPLARPFARISSPLLAYCRQLGRRMFDDYRPELHYMRGPGPKWRQKHGLKV